MLYHQKLKMRILYQQLLRIRKNEEEILKRNINTRKNEEEILEMEVEWGKHVKEEEEEPEVSVNEIW